MKAFESLLQAEFRWSQRGDQHFVASDDRQANAYLAHDTTTRMVFMIDGYKKAADLMVEKSITSRQYRDILVFPIIFNYRHFVELSLKCLISTYGRSVGIEPNWISHDLSNLWSKFAELLKRYGIEDPNKTDPVVEGIVAEFSKIDPKSFSYRYPVDNKGNPIPLSHEILDLKVLADVMRAVEGYFTGCDGYLDALERAMPECDF